MNKINYILIIIMLSIAFNETKKYRLTPSQNQKIRQAKTLQNNGLNKESKKIYYELFLESPFLKEAFYPLKKILKNEGDFKTLEQIYPLYLESNNNNTESKIDIIDILIWIGDDKWVEITTDIVNNKMTKEKNIKSLFNILLKNNQNLELDKNIKIIRENRSEDFFSYELGMHYAMNLSIKESIDEFILHLDNNESPWKYNIIRNKILSFPDFNNINNEVKTKLHQYESNNAKLILSDLEFRDKKFNSAYKLLKEYSTDESRLLEFIDSLIKNKEYQLAQTVINDIINSNFSTKTLRLSIIKLAELYEIILEDKKFNLPISSNIYKNELLDSPFVKIGKDENLFLENAIAIYDSLIVNNKDTKSIYNLAQIKYKILGDLDSSQKLFNRLVLNTNNSNKFNTKSIIEIINIMISKGDLTKAKETLQKYKNDIDPNELFLIKEIQILFYLNEWENLNQKIDTFLKSELKMTNYYNDILKIKNYIAIFGDNKEELEFYSKSLMKNFQNKRYESIKIISELTKNTDIEISSKMKYEHACLLIKQNNIEEAINILNTVDNESSIIESSILLKAEMYDYILDNTSNAVDLYIYLLENYPSSIYYDLIRLRLREITS